VIDLNRKAIGVFDSGLGGLTVVKELKKVLPNERIVYFGDTARVPYGSKSKEVIVRYSKEIVKFLKTQDVKMIVIACNTASAFALEELKKELDIPVIGVIEAGARMAVEVGENIGVIGTKGTVSSKAYYNAIKKIKLGANVYQKACPLFVPLIEEGMVDDPITEEIVKKYLNEIDVMIDSLVLGCTHYPLLTKVINKLTNGKIKLINPAEETAKEVKMILKELNMENFKREKEDQYFVSDEPENFKELGELFLGFELEGLKEINLEK
jgi:glutamate racemase